MNSKYKSLFLFIIAFLLVISDSKYLINIGVNTYIEYFVIGILTCFSLYTFFKLDNFERKNSRIPFLIINFLLNIGIVLQSMPLSTKIRLILTMISLSSLMMFSGAIIKDNKSIKIFSYGMFFGVLTCILMNIITSTPLLEKLYDKHYSLAMNFGFTGGMEFKNYYAFTILACFMGLYIYNKKTKMDYLLLFILVVMELISGSKGSYLSFFVFLILMNLKKYKFKRKFDKHIKRIIVFVVLISGFFVAKFTFNNILINSDTYAYRIRGVNNYINRVKNDPYHLLFGNAAMAYYGSDNLGTSRGHNYVTNIKRYLTTTKLNGYNGSYEMGFINALIKNGIIGIIGYFITYYYILKKAYNNCGYSRFMIIVCVFIVLLLSSLVESFICNIHGIFGIYCYLLINGLLYNQKSLKEN